MNITINIQLNQEQIDALAPIVEASIYETPEEYLESILINSISGYVASAYENSVRRLSNAVSSLPYETRQQIIQSIESQI